ncbi:MAG TPA: folate family ECF transporter S component [Clostridia bacterium]|nr:folate family ECF transporter S component [Clostridia bacterium]
MKKFNTRELVFLALLVSLNIVLTRIASIRISIGGIEGIRIGFGAFPIILGGIMFGPTAGGIVGTLGDIVGYFINPMGPYMPHFTFTAALIGIIPPIILKPIKTLIPSFWQLVIAIGIGQLVSSVILVPYFIQLLFHLSMKVTLPPRIITQIIQVPLYALFTRIILDKLHLALKFKAN